MRALVIFGDGDRPRWLKLLRKGFRHVSVAVEVAPCWWLVLHPFGNATAGQFVAGDWQHAFLAADSVVTGVSAVVLTECREPEIRVLPFRPYTCVEEVKRLLGLRLPWVLTPWQLHRWLVRTAPLPPDVSMNAWREDPARG